MLRNPLLISFLFFSLTLMAQEGAPLLRFPALSPDGSQVAFSYQGDIWTAPAGGGEATRLTIHEAYEGMPQWSPDGSRLLFQGNRYGNEDLYVMETDGGRPRRLTYHSTGDAEGRWISGDHVLFSTRRNFREVEREAEIHAIPAEGGTPARFMDALGSMAAPSPDGRYVAFVKGSCRITREAYRGPASRDIWLYDTQEDTYRQLTTDEGQDIYPDWGAGNTLYFLSARNGRYNIYALEVNEGAYTAPRPLTNFTDFGIRYFDAGADGSRLVFERGAGIYTLTAGGEGAPEQIEIDVTRDFRFDPIEVKTLTDDVEDYALSPNGKYLALQIRGELFLRSEDKDRKRTRQITDHPYRDRDPQWLNDSTLLFLSDRDGNYDLFVAHSADPEETDLFRTLKLDTRPLTRTEAEENGLTISPDRKQIAFRRGRGQLVVADIDAAGRLTNERLLLDGWATAEDLSWSPDSRWLAYALDDLDFNQEIYIHPVDGSREPVNISLHPRGDRDPVWSPDGSKLAFVSSRNNGDTDIWFAWLRRADWEKTQRDWEWEKEAQPEKKEKKDSAEVKPVTIDFEDIHERLVQVTRLPGNEGDLLISEDGETFYFSSNNGGRLSWGGPSGYHSIQWDGSDLKTLLEDQPVGNTRWAPDGKAIYLLQRGGKPARLNPSDKKLEPLAFSARMTLDREAEYRQIFHEAWRALEAGFYDPAFHGQDWEALRDRYETLALAASTSQDFRDLFNEMLGQLNASHMGLYGPDPEETQRDRTGQLGVEVSPEAAGLRITRVVPGSPADRDDSRLLPGEVIAAVNGEPVNAGVNLYEKLNGTAEERTLLTILGTGMQEREVVIRPVASLRDELYESWVDSRKALTERYSNGRLGYIHIQGMNWPSFERFERELTAAGNGKEGLVIDVRFNGGGWTTDMLMTVLNVRQHAYTIPRGAVDDLKEQHLAYRNHYPFGERLPLSAWTKPTVALCNENSYSNAEIFSHAYKTLGLGTLVGQPTFGAVISTGSYSLLGGHRVRMPFRAWYVKATDQNMELGPATPDLIVPYPPASKARGEDPQLQRAVERLLEEMGDE